MEALAVAVAVAVLVEGVTVTVVATWMFEDDTCAIVVVVVDMIVDVVDGTVRTVTVDVNDMMFVLVLVTVGSCV